MWGSGRSWGTKTVVCIACGTSIPRSEAREYDKHGDRWNRDGKTFEYFCKECHGQLCHLPREELEPLLVEFDGDDLSQEEFLGHYVRRIEDEYGPFEESES